MKIGIIGGGASGLVAAISCSSNNDVTILERNNECGKKILATGNGRCNYWNDDQDIKHYYSSTPEYIDKFINEKTNELVLDFFDSIGIIPKIKNGYYYPLSNQASTILNVLLDECRNRNVKIINNYFVNSIEYKDKFIINNDLEFDKVIVSTGSYASPKTGSDGNGFNLLNKHTIIEPLPALVQLVTKKYSFLKNWKGVRSDVRVSYEDHYEDGEIQLTDYGISGICVFNLSNVITRELSKGNCIVHIDFLPNMSSDVLFDYLDNSKSIRNNLICLLNDKLVDVILSFSDDIDEIISKIKNFEVEVVGTKSFEDAQTTSGGILLSEVNLNTMESLLIPNLYITGELLDIHGDCGGYNLGIAWRSGILAGNACRGDL